MKVILLLIILFMMSSLTYAKKSSVVIYIAPFATYAESKINGSSFDGYGYGGALGVRISSIAIEAFYARYRQRGATSPLFASFEISAIGGIIRFYPLSFFNLFVGYASGRGSYATTPLTYDDFFGQSVTWGTGSSGKVSLGALGGVGLLLPIGFLDIFVDGIAYSAGDGKILATHGGIRVNFF